MSKNGYDVAVPPNPTPELDFAGGYVYQAHHEATHIWTLAEWDRARATSRYLFPIATCWTPFTDPTVDANRAVAAWETIVTALGYRPADQRYAFGLDMEVGVAESPGATGYANGWRAAIRSLGLYDLVYSSRSAKPFLGDGPKWIAYDQIAGDVVAVQTGQTVVNGTTIDTDVADDSVPFFDTQFTVKGREMFRLVQIKDAPTTGQRAAVWQLGGGVRTWVQNPQGRDMLILFATQQGLPADIAEVSQQQMDAIPVFGPMPQ